jgi:hypothetical protein
VIVAQKATLLEQVLVSSIRLVFSGGADRREVQHKAVNFLKHSRAADVQLVQDVQHTAAAAAAAIVAAGRGGWAVTGTTGYTLQVHQ